MPRQSLTVLSIAIAATLFFTSYSDGADLKTLMEIGASQADIAKTLQQQSKIYEGVKSAIDSGAIKKGMSADTVRKKYGEPVIDVYDKKLDSNKWLYMPAESSHFSGEKIYLYFDKEKNLTDWKKIEK